MKINNKMQQISNKVFCDSYIASLKLETRLMSNPYYDFPYLVIKNFFSKSICNDIANYTYNTSEAEKAKVKTRLFNGIIQANVHESIRKTRIHKLPNIFLDIYEKTFKSHQSKIENHFSVALTTSTKIQTLEYTKGSFYIKHADDSNEIVNKDGKTIDSVNGKGELEVLKLFKLGGGGGSSTTHEGKVKLDQILRIIEENGGTIDWTGEKFEVKPMKLFRLNIATLKTTSSIAVASVQVHK